MYLQLQSEKAEERPLHKTPRMLKHLTERPQVASMGEENLLGLAEPLDIAQAALYLASNESCILTGHILAADSGVSIS